jgi:hypothetical protein
MSKKHSWKEFLDARLHAMNWMREELYLNDDEIAILCSMDKQQVSLILDTSYAKDMIEKKKRLVLDSKN